MKKILCFFVLISFIIFTGCNDDNDCNLDNSTNKVLMLKIDYTTLNFEGVKEFVFSQQTDTFTIAGQNVNSADDNCIHLVYKELNQLLFFGTMWWEGMGELIFPDSFELPEEYETVSSDDVIFPLNGFNCPYQNSETDFDFLNIWLKIQNLKIVRQYMHTNPNQKVHIFVYTPSLGGGDHSDWDYFVILKN